MNSGDSNSDEILSAYHEAGHAVVAYALGGRVQSIQLGGEADDQLPERFGDCRINWGIVRPDCDWQCQREVMAILAGPVAEMIYRCEPFQPEHFGPWKDDWQRAWNIAESLAADTEVRKQLLRQIVAALHRHMRTDPCWAAIAALADELLAHQWVEEDDIHQTLGFWLNSQ